MKTILTSWFALAAFAMAARAQTFSETLTNEYSFEKKSNENCIVVANIQGDVKVVAYTGDKVIVSVEKIIMAKTDQRLEEGKTKIQLGFINAVDTLVFYVQGTCSSFGANSKKNRGNSSTRWGYEWGRCDRKDCEESFGYRMNFLIKIPTGTNVEVSTINSGNVVVEGVRGKVHANNINGDISLTNLLQASTASTINGNVNVSYRDNPDADCRFYTLNGNINADFASGLAATLGFQSYTGDFYTNINAITDLPSKIETMPHGSGVKYKIKGNHYQVRGGGAMLSFETFNGNVYLNEKTN